MTVRRVVDMALEADSSFLEHRPPRVDTALLAIRALVFHKVRLEVGGEGDEDAFSDDRLERVT